MQDNKKSLANSELPVLADIGEAKAGMVCHAYVSKVQDNGIVVAFFAGATHGFVANGGAKFEQHFVRQLLAELATSVGVFAEVADDGSVAAGCHE